MRPVSDDFLRALRGSHRMFARAYVIRDYQTGTDPGGSAVEIPIFQGTVSFDAQADIRASVDILTDGHGTFPTTTDSLIAPYGNELFIERGIELPSGVREVVSLGYYRIYNVEQASAPRGSIRVQGYDRMSGIIDARLLTPISFQAGTTLGAIFDTLILEVYPGAQIEYDDPEFPLRELASVQVAEEERFEFLQKIVRSFGKIMYWDYRGVLVVRTPPDLNQQVWEVNAGENGVLVGLSRTRNREGVYNAVVALGESVNETPPVRGIAYDNNRTSPTYFFGRFGKVPRFFSSSFITTEEQATNAAVSILQQSIGLPQSINFSSVPNPALEPLDPVMIFDLDEQSIHVIETISIGLEATDVMTATTRRQIIFTIGV